MSFLQKVIATIGSTKLYVTHPEKADAVQAAAGRIRWKRRKKHGTGGLTMADLIDRDALIAEYDRVHFGAPGGAES